MNLRLTLTAGLAVILASVSLYPVVQGSGWFWAGAGAVVVAVLAGLATRAPLAQATVVSSALAVLAVIPLVAAGSWPLIIPAVVIVAVAVAGTARPRMRLLHALACLLTYLTALLIYLNVVLAARLSVIGVVPTSASASRLWSLFGQGMSSRALAPPVPGTPGVVALTAAGIGLVAVVTDLLAVRLRSPAAAGLPLLALYCVRVATSSQQGSVGSALVFCLGLIGYLALLAADGRERLRIWGRLVTTWSPADRDTAAAAGRADIRGLAAAGRRVGLAAACVALVLPLVIPGIGLHDLLPTDGTGPGSHISPSGTVALPNPVVQMRNQLLTPSDQAVLTYTTTAPDPREQYLQVYVLNYSAGAGAWILGQFGSDTQVGARQPPRPPGLAAGTRVTRTKTVVSLSQALAGYDAKVGFLPLPYAPASLQVSSGTWEEDDSTLMVYSGDSHLGGLSYTVTSTEANPQTAQLDETPAYPASIANNYLSFPDGTNGELAALAQQITKGASTPYEKALKLQSYFTSGAFAYNVTTSLPNSIAGLEDFLFTTKSGYCQQFAFAMAALARLAGIPSRVAVGFTAGSPAGKNTWKVTSADAHAWPELYFTGVGWLRFEPTPAGAAGQGTATVPRYAPAPAAGTGAAPPPASTGGTGITPVGPGTGGIAGQRGGVGALGGPLPHAGGSVLPWLLGMVILLAVLLIAPGSTRQLVRRRRMRARAGPALARAAWSELRDSMADYGIGYRASESPRAVASRVSAAMRLDPAACEAVARIADVQERALYSAVPPGPSGTLRADTAVIRRALARRADWAVRWRALLMPRSTLRPVRSMLQHALDVFGWMDIAGLRLRGAIRQRQE
jgi:transglutaminase-like putative cysteine protease